MLRLDEARTLSRQDSEAMDRTLGFLSRPTGSCWQFEEANNVTHLL